jgi:drug/metabolite transporter (DMT)-like permease
MQVLLLGGLMILFSDRGVRGLLRESKLTTRVGLMSVSGSAFWFLAMTLAPLAHVRALGQAELVFTVLVARFRFGEPIGVMELIAIAMVGIGAALLILAP